jgi:hypothetical protein
MKLINYDKYANGWSLKNVVLVLVVDSLVTGFFLGSAVTEGIYTHKAWNWAWPLILAFSSGVGALQLTL